MSNPNSTQPASKGEYMTRLWLGAGTVALLAPFVGKAFHIDDPIFLWTAEQIVQAPADFFGFAVNWYGVSEPMHMINKNPPLVSYYLALVGCCCRRFYWSSAWRHLRASSILMAWQPRQSCWLRPCLWFRRLR